MADRTALRDPPACEDRGVPIAVAELARCAPALIEVFTADQAEALAAHLTCLHLAANAVVVTEGARDRTMYVVIDGEAVARRGGVEVARMRAGEHFGELSLLVEAPRAATVTARGPLTVAALDLDAYHALATAHPAVALRLVEWIVAGVRTRLTEVSDSLSMLLRERSLPRRARVAVTVSGKPRTVATGVTAGALLPATVDGLPVVAALIDRRPVSLGERISSPCAIAPVTPASAEGERIHRRGLALLLLEAAHRVAPGLQLAFGHSLGFGQRVAVRGVGHDELVELAGALERELADLVAADLPVREELWYVEEAREYFTEAGWTEVSALLELWLGALVPVSTFGQVHALALDPPGPSAGALGGARVLVEDGELLLAYPPASAARPMDDDELRRTRAILQRMTSAQERWLGALGIDSVGAFNRACVGGRVSELIRVAEGYHEKRVSEIADQIRASGARVVAIAGPSSSGKTTFIKRLHTQLQVLGVTPFELSLDDYYVDRERTPRDASGEYDFEAFDALEVELLTAPPGRAVRWPGGRAAALRLPARRQRPRHRPAGPPHRRRRPPRRGHPRLEPAPGRARPHRRRLRDLRLPPRAAPLRSAIARPHLRRPAPAPHRPRSPRPRPRRRLEHRPLGLRARRRAPPHLPVPGPRRRRLRHLAHLRAVRPQGLRPALPPRGALHPPELHHGLPPAAAPRALRPHLPRPRPTHLDPPRVHRRQRL
jgi:uridine kinase